MNGVLHIKFLCECFVVNIQ